MGLYESVARVENGGDAFIAAFQKQFDHLKIDIRCDTTINACEEIHDNHVERFVLSNGETVDSKHCTFTIHPTDILKVLPRQHLSKAFIDRIRSFEPTAGFFSVFGVVDTEDPDDPFDASILSLFPTSDINRMMDPRFQGPQALVIMKSKETAHGKRHRVLNAFELSYPEHVADWETSVIGRRPPEYVAYKSNRIASIKNRILKAYSAYKDRFEVVDAASILTFRDFLNSPYGSAYGVKQKIGQFNLFGKLPLRNVYAAGQSAVLPGIVGAMMSSFIVGRSLVGKDAYDRFIGQRLAR